MRRRRQRPVVGTSTTCSDPTYSSSPSETVSALGDPSGCPRGWPLPPGHEPEPTVDSQATSVAEPEAIMLGQAFENMVASKSRSTTAVRSLGSPDLETHALASPIEPRDQQERVALHPPNETYEPGFPFSTPATLGSIQSYRHRLQPSGDQRRPMPPGAGQTGCFDPSEAAKVRNRPPR